MKQAPLLIVFGLFVWAVFLALGAYRFNHHWGRAAIVFGCTAAFVVFWAVMLGVRRSRLAREAREEQEAE
jgi:hypothetical protein